MQNYHYFLGGNDLEMEAVRQLLAAGGVPPRRVHDKRLGWGARASDYAEEIAALPEGAVAVLVELDNDLGLGPPQAVILDHHGERAGKDKPTVLEQLWQHLGMPDKEWGRGEFADFPLIAANDRGYIPAMRRLGASEDDIARIRSLDRVAQGITPEQEHQAEYAVKQAQTLMGGRLIIVELPHNRIAPVTDRLALENGYQNLLVFSPGEINFSGKGRWVYLLDKTFPGGWYGGNLPESGYWGHARNEYVTSKAVRDCLMEALLEQEARPQKNQ